MKALVTGGSGFVGGHVVRALLERGLDVRCLVRGTAGNLDGLDVERHAADLRDAESLHRAVRGCALVYHCAADYRLHVPDPETMYACNVDGTRNLLAAAAAGGVDRVVYTSTVGALGRHDDGRPADEITPVSLDQMVGHYKRSKFLAEREADAWVARGLDVVIVNPSAPIGERDIKPTATGQMVLDFLRGKMRAFVDTGLNLVDVRDVAQGHLLAAERGRTGEKYILGNRDMTLKQILDTLAGCTGRPAPRLRLPHWVPWTVSVVDGSLARLSGRAPRVPLDAVRLARHTMYFDAGKAVAELGLPQSPVEAALERAARWFADEGYVDRRVAESSGVAAIELVPDGAETLPTAIVTALPEEAAALAARLVGTRRDTRCGLTVLHGRLAGRRVLLATTGDGAHRAARGVERLLAIHPVRCLLWVGLAGGLTADLDPGDVIVARRVVDPAGHAPVPDAAWVARCEDLDGVRGAILLSSPCLLGTAAEKAAAAADLDPACPAAVDLESAAVARVARRRSISYCVLRSISDACEESLPFDFNACRDRDGGIDRTRLVGRALLRPGSWGSLLRLRRRARDCSRRLADAVEGLLAAELRESSHG